ncbi:MAG: hypothetical protein CMB77_07140 [Euryarchaeota archaeon]|nr:hypothetical protein [Euryarchaeota archaeon]|tara:strand:+ start:3922 stop:4743 length:822 start_codon:yes stop_codon:yes gene_type:complete
MGFWDDFTDYFTADVVPAAVSLGVSAAAPHVVPTSVAPYLSTPLGAGLTSAAGRLGGEYVGSQLSDQEFNLGNALTRAGIQGATTYILTPPEGKAPTLGKQYGFDLEDGQVIPTAGASDDFFSTDTVASGVNKATGMFGQTAGDYLREGFVNVPFARVAGAVAPSFVAPMFESPETQSIPRASDQQFSPAQGTTSAVVLPQTGQVTPPTNVIEATNIVTDQPALPSGVTLGDEGTGLSSFLVRDRVTGEDTRVSGIGNNFAARLSRRAAGGFG